MVKNLDPGRSSRHGAYGSDPLTGKSPEKNWSSVVVKHQRTFMVLKITSNIRGLFKSSAVLLYHSLETFPDILYMFQYRCH